MNPTVNFVSSDNYIMIMEGDYNWNDANLYCSDKFNTSLASIHNEEENEEVRELCNSYNLLTSECLIGLTDQGNDRDLNRSGWIWIDGSEYDGQYQNWHPTQPDGLGAVDCVAMFKDFGQWDDIHCANYNNHYFICNNQNPTSFVNKPHSFI